MWKLNLALLLLGLFLLLVLFQPLVCKYMYMSIGLTHCVFGFSRSAVFTYINHAEVYHFDMFSTTYGFCLYIQT